MNNIISFTTNFLPQRVGTLLIDDYHTQCMTMITLSSLVTMVYFLCSGVFSTLFYTMMVLTSCSSSNNDEYDEEECEDGECEDGESEYEEYEEIDHSEEDINEYVIRELKRRILDKKANNIQKQFFTSDESDNEMSCYEGHCGCSKFNEHPRNFMQSNYVPSFHKTHETNTNTTRGKCLEQSSDDEEEGFFCTDCNKLTCPHCGSTESHKISDEFFMVRK